MKLWPKNQLLIALSGLSFFLTGNFFFVSRVSALPNESVRCEGLLVVGSSDPILKKTSWSPPESILKIFQDMEKAKSRSRIHPDKLSPIDIDHLPIGAIVFLDSSKIEVLSLKGGKPRSLRFEVEASDAKTLQISNRYFGSFHFNKSELYGKLYRIRKFWLRSAFLPGEFVQLGWPGSPLPTDDLPVFNLESGKAETIAKVALPWSAKFIRVLRPGECQVEFQGVAYLVACDEVYPLNIGTGKILNEVLQKIPRIRNSIFVGDRIRFRDVDGYLRSGYVGALENQRILVQRNNQKVWIAEEQVFKSWTPGEAVSIRVDTAPYWGGRHRGINLDIPSGLLKEVLDGAALLASHTDFLQASFVDQLKILILFEHAILPWRRAGNTFETVGYSRFSEVLCSGVGVCRHLTPLMAAILSEAGLTPRILYRFASKDEPIPAGEQFGGHTWLEVDSPRGETFVIDPSGPVVKSQRDVQKAAHVDPRSSDAIWWGNPIWQQLPISTEIESN